MKEDAASIPQKLSEEMNTGISIDKIKDILNKLNSLVDSLVEKHKHHRF